MQGSPRIQRDYFTDKEQDLRPQDIGEIAYDFMVENGFTDLCWEDDQMFSLTERIGDPIISIAPFSRAIELHPKLRMEKRDLYWYLVREEHAT